MTLAEENEALRRKIHMLLEIIRNRSNRQDATRLPVGLGIAYKPSREHLAKMPSLFVKGKK